MNFGKFGVFVATAMYFSAGLCAASAADLPADGRSPGWVVPTYDWAGPYIGVNAGYGLGRAADTSGLGVAGTILFTDSQVANINGFLGGGQIGYDVRMDNWLAGVEADVQGASQTSGHSYTCPAGVCAVPAVSATLSEKLNLFGTVRARAGILATPTVLFYGTAGLAYGQFESNSSLVGAVRQTNFQPGWTAGAGIETIVAGNWSVKVEYLYMDLGRVSGTNSSTVASVLPNPANLASSFSSHLTDNIVRIGVNYRWGGPVIAKY
jgi:outer membrane immunogenic protein